MWAWGRGEGPAVGCIFDEIVFQEPYRDLLVRVGCAFDEIVFQGPYRDLVVPVGGGSSLCGCTLAGSAPTLNYPRAASARGRTSRPVAEASAAAASVIDQPVSMQSVTNRMGPSPSSMSPIAAQSHRSASPATR